MRLSCAATALLLAIPAASFTSTRLKSVTSDATCSGRRRDENAHTKASASLSVQLDSKTASSSETVIADEGSSLRRPQCYNDIVSLSFRELQRECKHRGLSALGNTASLRTRLASTYNISVLSEEIDYDMEDDNDGDHDSAKDHDANNSINFRSESDPNFDFKSALSTITQKASAGHWKAATRKLKALKRRHASPTTNPHPIPPEVYIAVLKSCALDRLHGARAAQSARKIMEELADMNHPIPFELGNACIMDCLSDGGMKRQASKSGVRDGHGGVDVALAMLAAMEGGTTDTKVGIDAYSAVVSALSRDGAVEEAILIVKAMVVEHNFTPPLGVFCDVANAACISEITSHSALVTQVLALAKASGYELESLATAEAGRLLLASGVIAAERLNNLALGLKLLSTASKAEGLDVGGSGDRLVCASSKRARRAAALIHIRAIDKATSESNWKLAVRILQLMPPRLIRPPPSVWRKVVTTCSKCEKSRKATAILLDWIKLAEEGQADKPPLNVFNTVVNACEICGEEELTLVVLDAMKKTHNTEGNIVTFNIALKRLAKRGNARACEGIIIGMLQANIEPSVVSYTTAIGACVQEPKNAPLAYEWLKRMKTRGVNANRFTYNTALAACLSGRLEDTLLGSAIAAAMIVDVDRELSAGGNSNVRDQDTVVPNSYTKVLARNIMKQLRDNWRAGDIDMAKAKATVRVPLLKLVDFDKSEAANRLRKEIEEEAEARRVRLKECGEGDDGEECILDELAIEYSDVSKLHRDGARIAEV